MVVQFEKHGTFDLRFFHWSIEEAEILNEPSWLPSLESAYLYCESSF
jgi:hypothetical protein